MSDHPLDGHQLPERDLQERLARLEAENACLRRHLGELEAQEGMLRFVIDSMPDFVSFVGRDLRYQACNRHYDQISGGDSQGLLGRHVREVLGTKALDKIQVHVDRVLRGERVCYEDRVDYRFGEGQYVEVNYVPRIDPVGEVQGFAVLVRNITALRRMQADLVAERDLLSTLINSVPDLVCLKDGDGRWLLANRAALAWFDLDPEDYRGKTDRALLQSDQAAFFRDGVADETAWERGVPVQKEVSYAPEGGAPAYFDVIKVPLFNEDGSRRYLVVVGRNTTELQQARQASEEAARAKGEFLANLSHEIRTPVNAILGYSRLARQTHAGGKLNDYLGRITSASDLLLGLVNDVLDYSKISACRLELEQTPFSPAEVFDEIHQLMVEQAERKDLELRLVVDRGLPACLTGDPLRLRQVLINLIGNAIKFTDRGHVTLFVQRRAVDPQRATLTFEVRDSGIGIDPAQVHALFAPFTQAKSSHSRRYGGTGLGLAISKHLVDLMGGELGVDSEPGRGSRFRFTLSLGRCAGGVSDTGSSRAEPAFRVGRVLLAEDTVINQELLRDCLEGYGLSVEVAADGQEALARVGEGDFDLVFMDLQMPRLDGIEATQILRRDPRFAKLPIVALTAYAQEEDRQRCLEAGMSDYLAKPVEPEVLLQVLDRWLGPATGDSSVGEIPKAEGILPDALPGLDLRKSLGRLGGDEALLRQLLLRFREDYGEAATQVGRWLDSGNLGQARTLVHNIKGAAGALGASRVFQAATKLDESLGRGDGIAEDLDEFRKAIGDLLGGLARLG